MYNNEIFRIKELVTRYLPLAIEEALKTMTQDPERCLFNPEKDHMIISWLEITEYRASPSENLNSSFRLEYALDCYNDDYLVYPYDARGYCYVTYDIDSFDNATLIESN